MQIEGCIIGFNEYRNLISDDTEGFILKQSQENTWGRSCSKEVILLCFKVSPTRILLIHKKNEIMPFAATWMDLEIITLSEVSQTKTNII